MPTHRVPANPATDRDPAGVFKVSSGVVAVASGAAVLGALLEPRLSRRRRAALVSGASLIVGCAVAGFRTPSRAAALIVKRPTVTLLVGAVPALAAPWFGRTYNAMHILSITGASVSASVLGQNRQRHVAGAASGVWLASLLLRATGWEELRRDRNFVMDTAIVPLSFFAAARISPDLGIAGRELSQLEDKLKAAGLEQEALQGYRERLMPALKFVRPGFRS